MLVESTNPGADIFVAIVLLFAGIKFTYGRKKFINGLLASDKVFWRKIGFTRSENQDKRIALTTNIMIPIMGAAFLVGSAIVIYKVILYFLK